MRSRTLLAATLLAALLVPAAAFAELGGMAFARLEGRNEVPSVHNDASGHFSALRVGDEIHFTLDYRNVPGFTAVAHIHLGQVHTNGGLLVFLCNNTPDGPQPRPCPQETGTVTGTITADDVIGPAAQGVEPGDLGALLRALKEQDTYVNLHSSAFPNGAIRGQVRAVGF